MLEIFLGDLIIANKKFQNDKGNIQEIDDIITGLLIKFSNVLLLEKNSKMTIAQRVSLITYEKKRKTIRFDKSNLLIKKPSDLLEYFLYKYGDNICLSELNPVEQLIIVKEISNFLQSALYYMTKYYPFDNNTLKNLKVLNPSSYSIKGWLDLKDSLPQVKNKFFKDLFCN
jgi:lipase chaperone LimK